jgi:hypothetical protein
VLEHPIVVNGSMLYSGDAIHTRVHIDLIVRTHFMIYFILYLKKCIIKINSYLYIRTKIFDKRQVIITPKW